MIENKNIANNKESIVIDRSGVKDRKWLSQARVSHILYLVAFVAGDSNTGLHKRSIYEHNGVAVCSHKKALCIATIVFAILFAISLIIAFAGPQNGTTKSKKFTNFRNFLDEKESEFDLRICTKNWALFQYVLRLSLRRWKTGESGDRDRRGEHATSCHKRGGKYFISKTSRILVKTIAMFWHNVT